MRRNAKYIETAGSRLAGGAVLAAISLLVMTLILFVWMQPAFAAESDATSSSAVKVSIRSGEHGSVNEKSGDFSVSVRQGESLKLTVRSEEGYVIGRVLLNDEPLAAGDLKELLGSVSGNLDLEELDDDISVEIIFMTTSEFEIQREYGQVAEDLSGEKSTGTDVTEQPSDGNGDSGSSQQDANDASSGTENTASDIGTGTSGGTATDPSENLTADASVSEYTEVGDDLASDVESGVDGSTSEDLDRLIESTEAEEGDDTDNETNWGTTEDYEDTDATANVEEAEPAGEGASADVDDNNHGKVSDQAAQTESAGSSASSKTASTDSAKEDSNSSDDGKGDYYDTPKTGDERSPLAWLTALISGLIITVFSAGYLVHRKRTERDRRWSV